MRCATRCANDQLRSPIGKEKTWNFEDLFAPSSPICVAKCERSFAGMFLSAIY
jgi:hypothetical protein